MKCPAVGVEVTPGIISRGDKFADDTHPILKSMSEESIASFLSYMETFGQASNQWLNAQKTVLLPIGNHSNPLPKSVGGIKVVKEATSLGVPFSNNGGGAQPDWAKALDGIEQSLTKIASFGLSTSGRAAACNSYGTSTLHHLVQFCGPPPPKDAAILSQWISMVIDRGLPPSCLQVTRQRDVERGKPAGRQQREWRMGLPGLRTIHTYGAMVDGGFGCIPWDIHAKARTIMLARRFFHWLIGSPLDALAPRSIVHLRRRASRGHITDLSLEEQLLLTVRPPKPLWIDLANHVLWKTRLGVHPILSLLSEGPPLPMGPLSRIQDALSSMGPLAAATGLPILPLDIKAIARSTSLPWWIALASFFLNQSTPLPTQWLSCASCLLLSFIYSTNDKVRAIMLPATWSCMSPIKGCSGLPEYLGLNLMESTTSVRKITAWLLNSATFSSAAYRSEFTADARSHVPICAVVEAQRDLLIPLKSAIQRINKLGVLSQYVDTWQRMVVNGVRGAGGHDIALSALSMWSEATA
jgi:hypothetical protein